MANRNKVVLYILEKKQLYAAKHVLPSPIAMAISLKNEHEM